MQFRTASVISTGLHAAVLLWALLFIVSAIYMGAIDAIREGASGWQTMWKGIGIFLIIWGVLALIGAMQGSRDILQPIQLGGSSGGGNVTVSASNAEAMFEHVQNVDEKAGWLDDFNT